MKTNDTNKIEKMSQGEKNQPSETGEISRKGISRQKEIRHFAASQDEDGGYGDVWTDVVHEYLKTRYGRENHSDTCEVTAKGIIYQVMERRQKGITVFYDASGDTLFDVANERLDREYERLMNDSKKTETGAGNKAGDEVHADGADTAEKVSAKQEAKEKLEKELEGDKDKNFAEPVIGYLIDRCAEDEGLSQDVIQEHKTWKKCIAYIYEKARKQAVGNRAAIRDSVVYEWAEDYYHKDDKAEEAEKARKETEKKEKRKKENAEKAAKAKKKPAKAVPAQEKKTDQPRPKKKNKDMEGQLDMFSMMGI